MWLDNPVLIIIVLGKQSQEFPKNLGRLVSNYCLPNLLVTYGSASNAHIHRQSQRLHEGGSE